MEDEDLNLNLQLARKQTSSEFNLNLFQIFTRTAHNVYAKELIKICLIHICRVILKQNLKKYMFKFLISEL